MNEYVFTSAMFASPCWLCRSEKEGSVLVAAPSVERSTTTNSSRSSSSSSGGSMASEGGGGVGARREGGEVVDVLVDGEGVALPIGWRMVESRSRPGTFSYENIKTKERISWRPNAPAPSVSCHVVAKLQAVLQKQEVSGGRGRHHHHLRTAACACGVHVACMRRACGVHGAWQSRDRAGRVATGHPGPVPLATLHAVRLADSPPWD